MSKTRKGARSFMVLWRWQEAQSSVGEPLNGWVGNQMRKVEMGDKLFFVAIREGELYLLNALTVTKTGAERDRHLRDKFGRYRAEGKSMISTCRLISLGATKWRLRFQSQSSDRLRRSVRIEQQLQRMRRLKSGSAHTLVEILNRRHSDEKRVFKKEGRRMEHSLSVRERDPAVRITALEHFGRICMVCGMDFAATFGDFAADCVEVHHLDPIGGRGQRTRRTEIGDVIVVCPNCHRALHKWDDPADWEGFKKHCGF